MATYQYKCNNDHYTEEVRSVHDDNQLEACPECGEVVKRVYSVPQFTLVGKGFYRNGG